MLDQDLNSPTTLTIVRGGAIPSASASLGFSVTVPQPRFQDRVFPADGDLFSALDWPTVEREGSQFRLIDATSLICPSAWEKLFVDWVSGQTGAQIRWASARPENTLASALDQTGAWQSVADVPANVKLRRAATRRGEAKAVVRDIRVWLAEREDPAAACDDVLVLLPSASQQKSLWLREFKEAGLPVRVAHYDSIATHAISRWVISLARLAPWETHAISRYHLRSVLEAPCWTQSSIGSGIRVAVRNLLTSIRREAFVVQTWRQHVRRASSSSYEQKRALDWTTRIVDGVCAGDRPLGRLYELVKSLKLKAATVKRDDAESIVVADKVLRVLHNLSYAEEKNNGVHPLARRVETYQLLEEAFSRTWLNRSEAQDQGVTLSSYEAYDGRPSTLLFAAGLGEGDFPSFPSRLDAHEENWARALELLTPDDPIDQWVEDELERQILVFRQAVSGCSGRIIMSYASEGSGTEERYPGPLLSLLVGAWSAEEWAKESDQVEYFDWSDEVPNSLTDVNSWGEARLFALNPELRDWAERMGDPTRLLPAEAALSSSLQADDERRPYGIESPELGVYAGLLPGRIVPPDAYSASAIQSYGQCGMKYYLGGVLGIRDNEDLADTLAATEVGTLLHRAFSEAAQSVIDIANGELWSFCIESGENAAAAADRVTKAVLGHLDGAVRSFLKDNVSFSEPLVHSVVSRWEGAIRLWAREHVRRRLAAKPSEHHFNSDNTIRSARRALDEAYQAVCTVHALADGIEDGSIRSQAAAGEAGPSFRKILTKKSLKQAFKDSGSGGVEALLEDMDTLVLQKKEDVIAAENRLIRQYATHLNRDVAHAELAFGMSLKHHSESDSMSTEDPLVVRVNDSDISVRGEVDRVDWDRERNTLAVRDFKTGRMTSKDALTKKILTGEHLQLPLYALAVEEMTRQGYLPHLKAAQVVEVSLEHPRDPLRDRKAAPELLLGDDTGHLLEGEPSTWRSVSNAWLKSHVTHIEQGQFPLQPVSCPIERSGWCDFARVCGYTRELGRLASDSRDVPCLELRDSEPSKKKASCFPDVILPQNLTNSQDYEALERAHQGATEAAADTTQDVAISAGAGTGKTYNLVLRYLSALADGVSPKDILCITFTRRAAGEMKKRIREALLGEPAGPQLPLVKEIRADKARFRRVVVELSVAPIVTLDALAGEIFREGQAASAAAAREPAQTFEIVTSKDVEEELATFVSQQFLKELEAGDESITLLAKEVDPVRARELLKEASCQAVAPEIQKLKTVKERANYMRSSWLQVMQPAAELLAEELESWDIEHLQSLITDAFDSRIHDDARLQLEGLGDALNELETAEGEEFWRCVSRIMNVKTNISSRGQVWLGRIPFQLEYKSLLAELAQVFAFDPDRAAAVNAFAKNIEHLDRNARNAAHATIVAERWGADFREYVQQLGRLRFSDVEVLARHYLEAPELEAHLASRFTFEHVFLDESQDTSQSQLDLVEGVAALIERTKGERPKMFFVGDVKQSIYAFRGAEVDVFVKRVGVESHTFTINRRSTPTLLKALNAFHGALLPARGEQDLDPRSEVPFDGLAWPEGTPDKPAAVELLVEAGRGWSQAEEPVEPDDDALELFRATTLQKGLVARLAELVAEYPPNAEGPQIAILIGSWARAEFYRDLLGAYGLRAAVQGGRGLLTTLEVDSLVQWFEAATHANLHSPFAALLRGPGIAISDAGLYAMRRGYGVSGLSAEAPYSLKQAANFGEFNAKQALEDWAAFDPDIPREQTLKQLEKDEASLRRFRSIWNALYLKVGVMSSSDWFATLADKLEIWPFWFSRTNGRQAVANIRTFLDVVRDMEAVMGNDPQQLVRRLKEMRGASDPSAGGLEARNGAEFLITTYWQSKGLEWPVVVLPDLHSTKIRGDAKGLADNRIFMADQGEVVFTPEVRRGNRERPMTSDTTEITQVLDQYRKPMARAELRRLLYVATTRAKEKLVMSALFHAPTQRNSTGHAEAWTLSEAKDWATTMRVVLGLHFDEDGQVLTQPENAWEAMIESGAVEIRSAQELALRLTPQRAQAAPFQPLDEERVRRWRFVTQSSRVLLKPSDHHVSEVPPPTPHLSTKPANAASGRETAFESLADTGTAFHALLESSAFLPVEDLGDLIRDVLEELQMDLPLSSQAARRAELLTMTEDAYRQALAGELRTAAMRGCLFHEIPIYFPFEGSWVHGVIDVIWRDQEGRWHIIDYKTGGKYPTRANPLPEEVKKNYAQVRLYSDGMALMGLDVASFGLWYTSGDVVVRWAS